MFPSLLYGKSLFIPERCRGFRAHSERVTRETREIALHSTVPISVIEKEINAAIVRKRERERERERGKGVLPVLD